MTTVSALQGLDAAPKKVADFAAQRPQIDNFAQEFIHGSGIDPALYATTVQVVGDVETTLAGDVITPIHTALNWSYRPFGRQAQTTLRAALLRNEDGSCWQAKLAQPKLDAQSGKRRKYEAPKGAGARAFFPKMPGELWQRIAMEQGFRGAGVGAFWDWVAAHPEIPIVITEGGKKALAALSQGYVTIALYGIHAGVSKYETIGGEKVRRLQPQLIPDLQRFAVTGREFVLAFDQDVKLQTRRRVEQALGELSYYFEQAGSQVRVATWDGQAGRCKGLDDLIVQAGVADWAAAYDAAIPAGEWRIGCQLATAVRRAADLSIGALEFSTVVDQLPQSGIVALHGGKGTGKSEAITQMLGTQSWLSFTPLVSLGRDQAASWDGVFINDGDMVGSQLLKDGAPVAGASVCIPSLLKVQRMAGQVIILDELTATLEFLLQSKLANQDGLRPLLLAEFQRRIQAADLVILADADLNEEALTYIETLRGESAYLVRSERQALTYDATLLDGRLNGAVASLLARVAGLPPDKLIYLNSDSKAMADSLARLLAGVGVKSLLITSDTSGGDLEAAFLASKGATLPTIQGLGIRAIITSPTVTQGFSIKAHTDLLDSVWGFYKGGSITAHGMAQSLDRVRANQVPRFIHVAKCGQAYSKLSKAQTVTAFLQEFQQISTATLRLVKHNLTPDIATQAAAIDWQSQNLKMLAALAVRRNRGMAALRDTLVALLRQEGKRIHRCIPKVTVAAVRAAGKALKAARHQVTQAQAAAVAQAQRIDDAMAKQLSTQTEALTPEQRLSLTQWQLRKFYQLDQLEADDVLFDRKGTTQQAIRNLEAALSHAKATERTVKSLERQPQMPQDWDKTAIRRWLMQQAGMTQLIAAIVAGEVTGFTSELTQPVAGFIRSHATEFRLGFGFSKLDRMSDQQIVGILLATCGIKTKRHRRRGTYSIDAERLADLLAVLQRRQSPDPYPQDMSSTSEVWISSVEPEAAVSTDAETVPECPSPMQNQPRQTTAIEPPPEDNLIYHSA